MNRGAAPVGRISTLLPLISCALRFAWLACLLLPISALAAGEASRWFAGGLPTRDAIEAVQLLEASAQDGLEPSDYQAERLARRLDAAAHGSGLDMAEQTALSMVLELELQSLISDMHRGRVEPRAAHVAFGAAPRAIDAEAYLRDALARHELRSTINALRPRLPQYARLMRALARYRALEAEPALQGPLPPLPGKSVASGDTYERVPHLQRRLAALGDLQACALSGAVRFEECHAVFARNYQPSPKACALFRPG